VLGVTALLTLLWLAVFGGGTRTLRVRRSEITLARVEKGTFEDEIPVQGEILPLHSVYLDALEGGRVAEVFATNGSRVTAGQKLLQLENSAFELELIDRESDLVQQQNNLRAATLALEQSRVNLEDERLALESKLEDQERLYRRAESLHADALISEQDFDRIETEYKFLQRRVRLNREARRKETALRQTQVVQMREAVKRLQENLDTLSRKRDNLLIRAPESGLLTAFESEVGQLKKAGDRLGQVDSLNGFKVRAHIDEHYLAKVRAKQSASLSLGGKTFRLAIDRVYPQVKDGSFEADLVFADDEPDTLQRGQTVHLRVRVGEPKADSLLLARGAFVQETGGNWAFVVDEGGRGARRKTVRLGRQNADELEVLGGLQPGDLVVVSSYAGYSGYDRLEWSGS